MIGCGRRGWLPGHGPSDRRQYLPRLGPKRRKRPPWSSNAPSPSAEHRKEFDEALRYRKGESYGIPYRILTPRGLENVLVAGRCVSADVKVHGSLRVMPGRFITGQAAGVAAAMAAQQAKAPRRLEVKDLQQRLKAVGGYLPNA